MTGAWAHIRVGRRRSTEQALRLAKHLPRLSFTPSLEENVITDTREAAAHRDLIQLKPRCSKCNSTVNEKLAKITAVMKRSSRLPCFLLCTRGLTFFSWMLILLLEKVPSILSQWNAETMGSQAGELSGGCRAIEPARNCTQCSQRSRMDPVPSLPNTLFSPHLLLLNYLASSAPTKKS